MKIILITGQSCTGKTYLSKKIQLHLGTNKTNIISMDDYYFPQSHFKNTKNINWDIPSAYNLDKFFNDIKKISENKKIKKHIFIYGKNIYSKNMEEIIPKDVLIIEGIFSFLNKDILDIANKKIILDSDEKIRYKRRLKKDSENEPNFNLEHFNKYWDNQIKNYQINYFNNYKNLGKLFNTNNLFEKNQEIIKKIIKYVEN